MNKLKEIKQVFLSGKIDKWQYIDKMYEFHANLFDYVEFIVDTNISSINIIDEKLIMTFKDSGIKFICSKNDKRLAPLDTINFGTYEIEELNMQLNLIDEGFNVFDVGGNFGWYAMHIAKYKQKSNVYSFEPIPSTFKHLNENIKLNALENIKTYNIGFSEVDGCFDFFFDPTLSVNASLANVSGKTDIIKETCIVKKFDDFILPLNTNVDYIKCDVEGAELLVFNGAIETIKKELPIVFSEMLRKWTLKFKYHPNDIIKFFTQLGYLCYTLDDNKLKPFFNVDENTIETNYFFLHKEKHSKQIKLYAKTL